MARSMWRGAIQFGLVTIPVKLYLATESSSIGFNLLHASCLNRIQMKVYCPYHDEVIPRSETVRGYERSKGKYVVVTEEDKGRRLSVHLQRADRTFSSEPDWVLRMPTEVVSWALLDLRAEPGAELLLLTPTGVLSVSISRPGLAGNARVELREPVFPELSEPDRLPHWPWLLDLDCDERDDLLIPQVGRLARFVIEGEAGGDRRLVPGGLSRIHRDLPIRSRPGRRPDKIPRSWRSWASKSANPRLRGFAGDNPTRPGKPPGRHFLIPDRCG